MEEAAEALGAKPRTAFLTQGRLQLAAFARMAQHRYIVRAIDRPAEIDALPFCKLILARGPFSFADELELMKRERIDALVTKNSGGRATYAKIEAARELGIEVVMVRRPPAPEAPTVSRSTRRWPGSARAARRRAPRAAPSTMLRMVPLPRRQSPSRDGRPSGRPFAAWEDFQAAPSHILPCEAGEGDRPKAGGGGCALIAGPRRRAGVNIHFRPPSRAMKRVSLEPTTMSVAMSASPGSASPSVVRVSASSARPTARAKATGVARAFRRRRRSNACVMRVGLARDAGL